MKLISFPFYTFPTQLQSYVDVPHRLFKWLTCTLGTTLHEMVKADDYILCIPKAGQSLHPGNVFIKLHTVLDTSPLKYYASVNSMNDTTVCLHSWTRSWTPAPMTTFFWDEIRSYRNQSLWWYLCCDSNGS
jgi:hypothetical protein